MESLLICSLPLIGALLLILSVKSTGGSSIYTHHSPPIQQMKPPPIQTTIIPQVLGKHPQIKPPSGGTNFTSVLDNEPGTD
jgi:hypothetical protein